MKKKRPTNTLDKALEYLDITERFGVFEFATAHQLRLVRTIAELLPPNQRKRHENLFSDCAELGAWVMLGGISKVVPKTKLRQAADRAKVAIDKEYKPSQKPRKRGPKQRKRKA